MSDIAVRGSPAPLTIGRRSASPLQIIEIALIVVALGVAAFFGYSWSQARTDYNSAQVKMTTAQQQLKQAQGQLSQTRQVASYVSVYLSGYDAVISDLIEVDDAIANENTAGATSALDRLQTQLDRWNSQLSAVTVPSTLTYANSEVQQAIDHWRNYVTVAKQAFASQDTAKWQQAVTEDNDAFDHMSTAENLVTQALGSA